MTGRDLIIYILEHGLEDEQVFENGRFIGFMTVEEAAVQMKVGAMTIRLWVALGQLQGLTIGESLYIPADAKSPIESS